MLLREVEIEWRDTIARTQLWAFVVHTSLLFDVRPMQQAFIKANIIFTDGATLHLREFIDCSGGSIEKLSYSFHAQDEHQYMIFRYDNAPHKPPLGFAEHKHCLDGSIIQADPPLLQTVVDEMISIRNYA
jgi:Family of unknown function (DUF6516)